MVESSFRARGSALYQAVQGPRVLKSSRHESLRQEFGLNEVIREQPSQTPIYPTVWKTVLRTSQFPNEMGLSVHNYQNNCGSPPPTRRSNDPFGPRNGGGTSDTVPGIHEEVEGVHFEGINLTRTRTRQNALSIGFILNDDDGGFCSREDTHHCMCQVSRESSGRTANQWDYAQGGAIRTGRWSIEEENYAHAMIDAFKRGLLPLHYRVSLRKFLSKVLGCHPMRISKKFVGSARNYHWYRREAGKVTPGELRSMIQKLCQLENAFCLKR